MAYALEVLTSTSRRYQQEKDKIKEFINIYEMPLAIQKKLYKYTDTLWHQNKGFDLEDLMKNLPKSVKAEVMMALNTTLVANVPLFKQCSDRFLEAVIVRLGTQVCLAGDYIFKQGEQSRNMFFIREGRVDITIEDADLGEEENIGTLVTRLSFLLCSAFSLHAFSLALVIVLRRSIASRLMLGVQCIESPSNRDTGHLF